MCAGTAESCEPELGAASGTSAPEFDRSGLVARSSGLDGFLALRAVRWKQWRDQANRG